MWNSEKPDTGYESNLIIDWLQISKAIGKLNSQRVDLKIGLLNFHKEEINTWQSILPRADVSVVHLDHIQKNVTWEDLYPEWIDEEEESEVPSCPNFPDPKLSKKAHFDVVAVKLPCRGSKSWSRDVARLHLQLAAARIAAAETCVSRRRCMGVQAGAERAQGEATAPCWVLQTSTSSHRVAYATILHSESVYVCGAITVAQSIRQAGSTIDLIILVDENINNHHRSGLKAAGWKIRTIKRIRNPKAEPESYNEWNYSKFWLWRLTDYEKIIFIDADLLILRNIDILFSMPEISAIGNNATLFNSGVMVIEPSNCTFQLFGADPPTLYVLHYLGLKPWSCYRDYDCNWNVDRLQEFASDVAHARWWKVHDRMTTYLQSFCLLSEKQKGQLEWDRIQAKKANYSDVHWKRTITDPRRNICNEEICSLLMLPEYHFLAIIYVGENNSACDEPAFHPRPPK